MSQTTSPRLRGPGGRALRRWLSASGGLASLAAMAAEPDLTRLPPPANHVVDYDREVRPILEASCLRCHGPEQPKSRLRLDDRDAALRGGATGVALRPGDSAGSPLVHYVAGLVEDMEMPPKGKGQPLSADQIGLLRAWIDQGAPWSAEPTRPTRSLTVTTGYRAVSVEGNDAAFRAREYLREGFSGGIESLNWRETINSDTELSVTGRGLYDQGDYGLAVKLRRRDLGYLRTGVETWRKYFDNTGGVYAPYGGGAPVLDRELTMDLGRGWIELGLTLPEWPRFSIGYEYQWRDGDRSTVSWGLLSPDPLADPGRAIVPGWRAVDERIQVFKVDVSHDLAGFRVEDNLRVELYDLESLRTQPGDGAPEYTSRTRDQQDHVQVANAVRLEKQVKRWLFVSGGYLFTHLEGDGAIHQSFTASSPGLPSFDSDAAEVLSLEQQSHTLNANALVGPWEGWSASGGVQAEWMQRDGLADLLTPGFPDPTPGAGASGLDRTALDETVGFRWHRLPASVFYGEVHWQQEWNTYRESVLIDDLSGDARDFERDTAMESASRHYRAGVTVSPWTAWSFDVSYGLRRKTVEYGAETDQDLSPPFGVSGNGYPAFIQGRRLRGDEVDARVIWRASAWAKLTLKYQYGNTRYDTTTAAVELPDFPDPLFYPGGSIRAGREQAHTATVAGVLTPWKRLYASVSTSYRWSHLVSGVDDSVNVLPYAGDVWSVLASAQWLLSSRTDVRASYSWSRGDYTPDHEGAGLPLGIRYQRHGVTAGLTHRFDIPVSASVQWGYFDYDEPTAGGDRDYTAQAVVAGLTWTLR